MAHPLPTLPFHLMMQGLLWTSCNAALSAPKPALPSWNALWPNSDMQAPVRQELNRRNRNLLNGLHRYLTTPFTRKGSDYREISRIGHSRLLDFGEGGERHTVLLIPSLINHYYLLDMHEGLSFVAYLKAQGIRPLVLDWGLPDAESRRFGLSDYITKRMLPLCLPLAEKNVSILGYCMGGLFALALAHFMPQRTLALMATPWDFSARDFPSFVRSDALRTYLSSSATTSPLLDGEMVQGLFSLSNPWGFARKFARFSKAHLSAPEVTEFMALEHWVNDPMPLSKRTAEDCLRLWVAQNAPMNGTWQVEGKTIHPQGLSSPVFLAIPRCDSIVPPSSSLPLAGEVAASHLVTPQSGHVRMVAGLDAERLLWQPYTRWLLGLS